MLKDHRSKSEYSEINISTWAAAEHKLPHSFEGKAPSDVNGGGNLEVRILFTESERTKNLRAIELPHWAVSAIQGVMTTEHARS
jgi:hypothetical protein